MAEKVIINDVGPRDGLQNQSKILLPAERIQLINKLLAAGLTHIEVGAFVSPKAVPAMAMTIGLPAACCRAASIASQRSTPRRSGCV